MIEKIKALLGSIRFWQLVCGTIVVILGQSGVISADTANTIAALFGLSVTIGTIDKVTK